MSADTRYDSPGFDDLLAAVAPALGEEVTKLLRNGKPLSRIAGWFERSVRGSIRGSVGDRVDLARRVLLDDRFSPSSLAVLLEGLRGDAHAVTERATVPDLMEATRSEDLFDAIVCALPDARATYEAFLRAGRPDAHEIIFVVTKESTPAVETVPNPRLVRPSALSDLTAALDAMVGASPAKAPAP